LRAAISVANNIAEGSGRRGKKEKRHAFEISQGSAYECIPMLTVLCRKKNIEQKLYEEIYNDCYEISKMIGGLIRYYS
jgi:four helix bundle protein